MGPRPPLGHRRRREGRHRRRRPVVDVAVVEVDVVIQVAVDVAVAGAPVSDVWFSTARRLFDAARGNDRFVKVRAVQKLLQAWQQAWRLSPDTITAPVVDEATGLPTWARDTATTRPVATTVCTSGRS